MVALPAGVDHAGQQGKGEGADRRTGTVAEATSNDPVAQGPFGVIAAQRQIGVVEHLEDRLPIVEGSTANAQVWP